MSDTSTAENRPIKKRWVVHICGFDPRGAPFYHKFFAGEAKRYAEREGLDVEVSKRRRWKKYWGEWRASCKADGYAELRVLYLGWDELIRGYWHRTKFSLFLGAVRSYAKLLTSDAMKKLFRVSKYAGMTMLYPMVAFIVLYLILGGLFSFVTAMFAKNLPGGSIGWVVLACLLGFGLASQLTRFFKGSWILQIVCFTTSIGERPPAGLEERMALQAKDLIEELEMEEPDELVVMAHSVGSITSMIFLDKFLADDRWKGRVRLLTVGQCMPMTAVFQDEEGYFVQAMNRVGTNPRVEWIDLTIPSDSACFYLVDPIQYALGAPVDYPQEHPPKFLSAKFMDGYSKEKFREIKRDGYMYHFRYLMTPDKPCDCDYIDMVLSQQPLTERFSHRSNQARDLS